MWKDKINCHAGILKLNVKMTCEATGLRQQEGAPGHEEEEGRLQQLEIPQLGELGDVAE